MDKPVFTHYYTLTKLLIKEKITVATMESCTGGFIASLITDTEGSSEVFKGGFVTYCNDAKTTVGVSPDTISKYGVYSVETASGMASVCRNVFRTDVGIGVTGTFANVDDDNDDSVPGQIYYAIDFFGTVTTGFLTLFGADSRREYKEITADEVCRELITLMAKRRNAMKNE